MLQIRWDTAESTPVERVALAVALATVKPPSSNREKFSWRLERKPQAFADAVERSHGACPVVCHLLTEENSQSCKKILVEYINKRRKEIEQYEKDRKNEIKSIVTNFSDEKNYINLVKTLDKK